MRFLLAMWLLLLPAAAHAFDPFEAAGIDQKHDAELPLDMPFAKEDGQTVTLRRLSRGKPILLAPVLHNCPNICGVTLSGLMEAVNAQNFRLGRDFTIVAFGIDPKEGPEDAARSLADLRKRFLRSTAVGVHALTGSEVNIRAVTDALGYRYAFDDRIGQYAHLAAVAVVTPEGRLSRWLYGLAPAANDLKLALTEAGRGQIGSWTDQILLLCYHYDPATGRYSPLIWAALRIGGGGTAILGSGAIAVTLIRERRRKAEAKV